MSEFTSLDGTVLLRAKGTYRQAPLFAYDNGIYAKRSGVIYVRLRQNGETSSPGLYWSSAETADTYAADAFGNLIVEPPALRSVPSVKRRKKVA